MSGSGAVLDGKLGKAVQWCEANNLNAYCDAIVEHGFDTLEDIAQMEESDIRICGISKAGHIKRMVRACAKLRNQLHIELLDNAGTAGVSPHEVWTRHVDDSTGKVYFTHNLTGKTAWSVQEVDPKDGANDRQTGSEQAMASNQNSPIRRASSWTRHTDGKTGKEYYYHIASGRTTWVQPDNKTSGEMLKIPEKLQSIKTASQSAATAALLRSQTLSDSETGGSSGSAGHSSDGWMKAFDQETGAFYFYNTETQETSWTNPYQGAGNSRGGELAVSDPLVLSLNSTKDPQENGSSIKADAMVVAVAQEHSSSEDLHDEETTLSNNAEDKDGDKDEDAIAPPTSEEKAAVYRLSSLRLNSLARNFAEASPLYSTAKHRSGYFDTINQEDQGAQEDEDDVHEYSEMDSNIGEMVSPASSTLSKSNLAPTRRTSLSTFSGIEPPDREYEEALTKQLCAANISGGRYELEIALASATELVSHHLLVDFEVDFLRSLSVARGKLKKLIEKGVVAGEPPDIVMAHAQASAEAKEKADSRRALRKTKLKDDAMLLESDETEGGGNKKLLNLSVNGEREPDTLKTEESTRLGPTDQQTIEAKTNQKVKGNGGKGTTDSLSALPSLAVQSLAHSNSMQHRRTETAPGLNEHRDHKMKKKRSTMWGGMSASKSGVVNSKQTRSKRTSLVPDFLRTQKPILPSEERVASDDGGQQTRTRATSSSLTHEDLESLLERSSSFAPEAAVAALTKSGGGRARLAEKRNSYAAVAKSMDYEHAVIAVELFGAGTRLVNGLYSRVGMRTQAPVFENKSGCRITREIAQDGTIGWICGMLGSIGESTPYYGAADKPDEPPQISGPPKRHFVCLEGKNPAPRVNIHFGKLEHDSFGNVLVQPWAVPFDRGRFLDCMQSKGGVWVVKHPRDFLGKPTERLLWIDTKDGGRLNISKVKNSGSVSGKYSSISAAGSAPEPGPARNRAMKNTKSLEFSKFVSVSRGKTTDVFRRAKDVDGRMCLSVIASSRTLDLRCSSEKMRDWLFRGLTLIALKNKSAFR